MGKSFSPPTVSCHLITPWWLHTKLWRQILSFIWLTRLQLCSLLDIENFKGFHRHLFIPTNLWAVLVSSLCSLPASRPKPVIVEQDVCSCCVYNLYVSLHRYEFLKIGDKKIYNNSIAVIDDAGGNHIKHDIPWLQQCLRQIDLLLGVMFYYSVLVQIISQSQRQILFHIIDLSVKVEWELAYTKVTECPILGPCYVSKLKNTLILLCVFKKWLPWCGLMYKLR